MTVNKESNLSSTKRKADDVPNGSIVALHFFLEYFMNIISYRIPRKPSYLWAAHDTRFLFPTQSHASHVHIVRHLSHDIRSDAQTIAMVL